MKKLMYFLISLLILLVCIGIGYVYVLYNLSAHSVYYAHHMPHAKSANPELVMAVDNLEWQEEPKTDNFTISYRILDGPNEIVVKNLDGYDVYIGVISFSYVKSYRLDIQFRSNRDFSDTYYTDYSGHFEDEEAQKLVDKIMNPIIAAQKKPAINLQWLFNAKYQKRFSK